MSRRSLGDVHPDWEFHTSGVFPGLKPVYRGPEAAALESVGLRE